MEQRGVETWAGEHQRNLHEFVGAAGTRGVRAWRDQTPLLSVAAQEREP